MYRPQQTKDAAFVPSENARLNLRDPRIAKLLIEGMRGAVKYGTAGKTEFGQTAGFCFRQDRNFNGEQWFSHARLVCRLCGGKACRSGVPAPEQVKLGVLVFLKRAHGSQAAEVLEASF